VEALLPQFETFAKRCGQLLVNAASPEAAEVGRAVGARSYGIDPGADARLEVTSVGPHRASGVLHVPGGPLALDVPQPGRHNLENAAAAALIALELGLAPATVTALLARFPGVARRFEVIAVTAGGVRVVDDYAHNGEKLRAAITTAQAGADRVLAVFQPHGFGPARFLRPELREMMPHLLRPRDRLCYAEIFYAGGTVARDVSSRMLADDLPAAMECGYAPDHRAVVDWLRAQARSGDTVLIMGARDPELPALARAAAAALP
jgi:UDP-N-acetylmuramate--alanine ligase